MAKPNSTTVEKGETFPHSVEMPLNDQELLAYADELTMLDTEQKNVDSTLNSAKGHHKQETERIGGRKETIMHRLRTKKEFKEVECYNKFDYFNGVCEIRRADNDKVVQTRKMMDKEFRGEKLFKKQEAELGQEATEGQIIGGDE